MRFIDQLGLLIVNLTCLACVGFAFYYLLHSDTQGFIFALFGYIIFDMFAQTWRWRKA